MIIKGIMRGESFAFEGENPVKMRYKPCSPQAVRLYRIDSEKRVIEEYKNGVDYRVSECGMIRALAGGRLPDRRKHAFFGHVPFDHENYRESFDYCNYIVFANYEYQAQQSQTDEYAAYDFAHDNGSDMRGFIRSYTGKSPEILLYGDSITEGWDCAKGLRYFERFKTYLKEKNIDAQLKNRAIGGECSRDGLQRLPDILGEQSHLTIIAYGMNDQNYYNGKNGIDIAEYERNIRTIADSLSKKSPYIILVAPALCHADWIRRSPNITEYADALYRIARVNKYAYLDVTHFWSNIQAYGKTDACMLANGINHPSAYGHYLYFCLLKALFEERK